MHHAIVRHWPVHSQWAPCPQIGLADPTTFGFHRGQHVVRFEQLRVQELAEVSKDEVIVAVPPELEVPQVVFEKHPKHRLQIDHLVVTGVV